MEAASLSNSLRECHVALGDLVNLANTWEEVLPLVLAAALIVDWMDIGLVIARQGTGKTNAIAVAKVAT